MYLIYCHGRCGSTRLLECVRRHVDPSATFDEPFKKKNALINGFDDDVRIAGNLERYMAQLDASHVKHLWSDMPLPLNKRLIAHPDVSSIVFLYRRDMFDFAMSRVAASVTREWHSATAGHQGPMPLRRLEAEAVRLLYNVPLHARLVRDFARVPVACVAYEDLYGMNGRGAHMSAAARVLPALGIDDDDAIRRAIGTELSPTGKYKDHSFYDRLFSNYADARAVVDPLAAMYLRSDADRPERILATDGEDVVGPNGSTTEGGRLMKTIARVRASLPRSADS